MLKYIILCFFFIIILGSGYRSKKRSNESVKCPEDILKFQNRDGFGEYHFFIAWVDVRVTFSFASLKNPCLRFIYSSYHF